MWQYFTKEEKQLLGIVTICPKCLYVWAPGVWSGETRVCCRKCSGEFLSDEDYDESKIEYICPVVLDSYEGKVLSKNISEKELIEKTRETVLYLEFEEKGGIRVNLLVCIMWIISVICLILWMFFLGMLKKDDEIMVYGSIFLLWFFTIASAKVFKQSQKYWWLQKILFEKTTH